MAETIAKDFSTPEAKKYNAIKNFLYIAETLVLIMVLSAVTVLGLSIFLRAYLRMIFDSPIILNAGFFFLFSLCMSILFLPVELYEGFILEHHFKLSTQSFFNWLKDYGKKSAITFFIGLCIVESVYVLIAYLPSAWWLYAAIVWLFLTLFLTKIFPYAILPLFFKSKVLPEGALKERLYRLAATFSFSLSDILVLELSAKTNKANAMVTGIGTTKRIYVSDTLLKDFTDEEIELVIAHELVHNRNQDIYKHIFVSCAVSMVSFYCCDLFLNRAVAYFGYSAKNDIATMPLLLLLFITAGLCMLPLQNGFSRRLEVNADRGAIATTRNPKAFIAMMIKLGKKNLAEFQPHRLIEIFLYDHPPLWRRISYAQAMLKSTAMVS